jgi:hypothetical protein
VRRRFEKSDKGLVDDALARILDATRGHPYATQELAHFVWERVPTGHYAYVDDVEEALTRVLRSEHNHLARLWEDSSYHQRLVLLALAEEATATPYAVEYHEQHELPANPSLQTALGALGKKEVVGRTADGTYVIVEPFLAEWLRREQRDLAVEERIRRQTARASARSARSRRAGGRRAHP